VPTTRRSRTIAARPEQLWKVISDPHHLPRWWPRVRRVEDVEDGAFTEVMMTAKGKAVRADFDVVRLDERELSLMWSQRLEGTPFGRLLSSAETEVTLTPVADGPSEAASDAGADPGDASQATVVTIEMRQRLTGFFPRFGGFMVRRAAAATIDEALDGLGRISG